jgi:hypothetical protein
MRLRGKPILAQPYGWIRSIGRKPAAPADPVMTPPPVAFADNVTPIPDIALPAVDAVGHRPR